MTPGPGSPAEKQMAVRAVDARSGYRGRRRRRVGVRDRVGALFTLPVIAAVLVAAVVATTVAGMLKTEGTRWNTGSPGQPAIIPEPIDNLQPTPGDASASPDALPSPEITPSLSGSPSPSASPSVAPSPGPTLPKISRYEAENATISQGAVRSNHSGYSGSGFVDYADRSGSYVEWNVAMINAGQATLSLRYANGSGGLLDSGDRPMSIWVNGVAVSSYAFPNTGGWTRWRTRTFTVSLQPGTNTVRAVAAASGGGPNVDYLEVQR